MKLKTLLVLSTSMVMTSTAFADGWVRPVPTTQNIVTDGETAQYLYNVSTQSFMLGGNDYETRASASKDQGMPWKIKSTGENTYELVDSVAKFKEWRSTFADSSTGIWVDNNNGANHDTWTITDLGGGKFKIGNTAFAEEFLGIAKDFADTRLYLSSYFTTKEPAIEADYEWTSVSTEAYDAWLAANDVYAAAMKLKANIDDAKKAYPSIDLAAEEAVYNNTASTKEEIEAAIASIPAKIKAAAEAAASVENPQDMTAMLTNPSFEEGNINGWDTKNSKDTGAKDNSNGTYHVDNADGNYIFNTWDAGYAITQTLESMPNGVYKLQGMVTSSDDCTNVYLLANGDHKAVTLEKSPETGSKQTYFTTGTMIFPTTDGKVTIGAMGSAKDGVSYDAAGIWWYKADNFHLYYLGNKQDAWTSAIDDYKAISGIADGAVVSKAVKEEWENTLKGLSATDATSYATSVEAINAAKALVDANVEAWAAYMALASQAELLIQDDKFKDVATELADYLTIDYDDIIKNLALSTEQIKEETAILQGLYDDTKSQTPAGTDVTNLIVNPDFANEWQNWSHTGTGGNVAANKSAKCAEAWNSANFDIHQDIENAPVGVYEVQVQGFYRYLRADNSTSAAWLEYFNEDGSKKTENVSEYITNTPAKIFINDNTSPMPNIFDYSVTPDYAAEHWTANNYYTDPNGEKCYPNNMTDAGEAFDRGDYVTSAVGLVAKKGDVLRIGMKGSSNQGGDSWAIFTRFKLIYQGFDVKVIKPALENALTSVNANALMGSDVAKEVQDAVNNGNAALQQTDGKTMFNALAAILAVQSKAETSAALFAELTTKAEAFNEALSNSDEARQTVIAEASALSSDIISAIEGKTYTDAQATEAINKMANLTKRLAVPASVDTAADDAAADVTGVITNNSFEEGNLNGWTTASGTGDTGAKENSNGTYTISNADGSYVFNTWNGSAIEGGFFVAQDIEDVNLPAGTYELKALVASDAGNTQKLMANGYETEVNTNGKETAEEVSVIFKLEKDNDKISIKVASESWFKADYFQLFYYGKNSSKETSVNTGVESIITNASEVAEIYTINGVKVSSLQNGINIIRTSNGVKKVMK
jgi:hypothetical protein